MRCLVTAGKYVNDIRAIARQRPITIEKLLESVFSVGSVPRLYSEDPSLAEFSQQARVETGSNTSTLALRVGGGTKRELSAWE
jgi:hypothetical protein